VKITLSPPDANGLRELAFGDPAGGDGSWFTWLATQHDLNDLEAVLAADKAMARPCPAEDGEHTCGLPRHDSLGPHQCRACPETWR
jgi:hypothetical protein